MKKLSSHDKLEGRRIILLRLHSYKTLNRALAAIFGDSEVGRLEVHDSLPSSKAFKNRLQRIKSSVVSFRDMYNLSK